MKMMASKYSIASIKRVDASSTLKERNAHLFSSSALEAKLEPAETNPIIAPSCSALQVLSNIESRANRISNSIIWSQVNHVRLRKPTYAQRAMENIRIHLNKPNHHISSHSKLFISWVAVNVERFATRNRSKKSSIGVASECR